jgi:hypothetical protein
MPQVSEVARVEAALKNKGVKELQWSLWYCKMRQAVASARPTDVRYWRAVEEQVQEILTPTVVATVYPTKKKKSNRGLGSGRELGEGLAAVEAPAAGGEGSGKPLLVKAKAVQGVAGEPKQVKIKAVRARTDAAAMPKLVEAKAPADRGDAGGTPNAGKDRAVRGDGGGLKLVHPKPKKGPADQDEAGGG